MKLHLKYKNIHPGVIAATDELFSSKPWRGDHEELQAKYEQWLKRASKVYVVPVPGLVVSDELDARGMLADYHDGTILMRKFSVTSLFSAFRVHCQYHEAVEDIPVGRTAGQDAQAWACSLFYSVRPTLFRKAVRNGGVHGVHPEDLLHPESEVSICSNCEEAIWLLDEERGWHHVQTGQPECEAGVGGFGDDETSADPVKSE